MGGPETTIPDIQRVVLVHHPNAKALGEDCESELRMSGMNWPVMLLPSQPNEQENAEMFGEVLEPGDAVGVVGGDGTYRIVAGTTGKHPVTSVAGGTVRDIGNALHGAKDLAPSYIFGASVAVSAFGLDCSITTAGQTTVYRTKSYLGAGKSANASATANTDEYRRDPRLRRREVDLSLGILKSDYTFLIVDSSGQERRLSDLTVAKGSRMARYGKLPVKHWEAQFRTMPVAGNRAAGCLAAARLMLGFPGGKNWTEKFKFMLPNDTLMHFDGDSITVPGGSDISVSLTPEPYTVLTTRLKAAA